MAYVSPDAPLPRNSSDPQTVCEAQSAQATVQGVQNAAASAFASSRMIAGPQSFAQFGPAVVRDVIRAQNGMAAANLTAVSLGVAPNGAPIAAPPALLQWAVARLASAQFGPAGSLGVAADLAALSLGVAANGAPTYRPPSVTAGPQSFIRFGSARYGRRAVGANGGSYPAAGPQNFAVARAQNGLKAANGALLAGPQSFSQFVRTAGPQSFPQSGPAASLGVAANGAPIATSLSFARFGPTAGLAMPVNGQPSLIVSLSPNAPSGIAPRVLPLNVTESEYGSCCTGDGNPMQLAPQVLTMPKRMPSAPLWGDDNMMPAGWPQQQGTNWTAWLLVALAAGGLYAASKR